MSENTEQSEALTITPLRNVWFSSQHKGEQVLLIVRRVLVTQLPWIINTVILSVLVLFGNIVLPQLIAPNQIVVFNLFSIFFIFSYAWVNFLLWYFTVGIITDERILDLDFYHIIYKEFSATTIRQVSDITTTVGGFLGSVLNFGDVLIKTEGFVQNIEFEDIAHPQDVVKLINNLMSSFPKNRNDTN